MDKTMNLTPRLSEKAYAISEELRTYVIDVPKGANQHTVAKAVAAQYGVTVTSVRLMNVRGKTKRTISGKGRRVARGRQNNLKKAYVTVKSSESLPIFAAAKEAEEKQEKTQERVAKAIEKQTEKETKQEAKQEAKSKRRGFHLPGRRTGVRGNK